MKFSYPKHVISLTVLVLVTGTFTGCQWLSQGSLPTAKKEITESRPQAPVVVDGTRTSYAEIVE